MCIFLITVMTQLAVEVLVAAMRHVYLLILGDKITRLAEKFKYLQVGEEF